eukprot:CAMPEP_0182885602 /NCGR_PEP_ID=MMETSP0034_2-20130328/19710_1 /TAXON_ID=156128 /ORGANISM="Nephroselmis pyriformis, Strain CCMP717" /LENGTH=55 /DNA_ID=CAMNT_0025018875 /DNA_START=72 /DNA_END=236 /DNA_ORIENTATION=+
MASPVRAEGGPTCAPSIPSIGRPEARADGSKLPGVKGHLTPPSPPGPGAGAGGGG